MNRTPKRNLHSQHLRACWHYPDRSGLTLSEVLISMLIMSVGVVSLATLFPISVLRTAQATQLTHSVFLRNNAEAAVESNLGLLSNSQVLPDTLAVVDPLGFQIVGGNLGGIVPRTDGGASSISQAQQLASLPDSWSLVLEDQVTAFTGTTVTVASTPAGIAPASGNFRLVMFDITGKLAVLKPLNTVAGSVLGWSSSVLPSGFTPARVRVEAQDIRYSYLLTVRKKLLPTVFNDRSWVADVDVAVFFNRFYKGASATPAPGDETPFALTFPSGVNAGKGFDNAFGVRGVDDDGNGTTDDATELGWPGSDDNRTVSVGGAPYLKKGSYMLETTMLKWYRIVDFNKSTGLVLLDQNVRFSPTTAALNGIFMKGLVEVYPLGSRTGQQ